MTEEPIITPHPDVESLSNSELRDALADADERLETLHKLPAEDRDPIIEPWLVQERMIILAELRRRYTYSSPSDNSEQLANFTSDYRNPLSEVKFEREVNLGELQAKAIEKGDNAVTFLPVLGQEKFIVKGWSGDETLVVLDTVRNLLGLRDEKDNSEVARALIPFIAAGRNKGQTLIAVTHDRKGGGEHGEGIAGGHAFLGVVDIAIELKREGQEDSARRLLRGWGRVFEIPRFIYELRDDVMVPLGSPGQVSLNELKARFANALEDNWQTTKQAIETIGEPKPSNDHATKALEELARESTVEREPPVGEGKKQGKTYKWRRAENFTSDSTPYRSEVKFDGSEPEGSKWTSEL
jgi:hypothetical protein